MRETDETLACVSSCLKQERRLLDVPHRVSSNTAKQSRGAAEALMRESMRHCLSLDERPEIGGYKGGKRTGFVFARQRR